MILETIRKYTFLKNSLLHKFLLKWVTEKKNRIIPFLEKEEKILDVGCGNCLLANALKKEGYHITGLDVSNLSIIEDFEPFVYDGEHMPYETDTFDCALLLAVLHHTDNPEKVLKETARVASRIIIIEDVYKNSFQKYLTFAMDTLVNLGHSNMTYQNKSVDEWKDLFKKLGVEVSEIMEKRVLLFFKQVTFVVEKNSRVKVD